MVSNKKQEQLSISDNVGNPNDSAPLPHFSLKEWIFKHKWWLVPLLLIMVATAVGCVLLYNYLQPRVVPDDSVEIDMPNSSKFVMVRLRLSDINLFQPNFDETMYFTFPTEDTKGRSLKEVKFTPIYLHSYNTEVGINIKMGANGNTTFYVEQATLLTYAEKELEKETKGALKKSNNTNMNTTIKNSQEFCAELDAIFTEAMAKSDYKNVKVKFVNQTMAKLKINMQTKFIEFDQSASPRLLLQEEVRRMLFIGGLLKKVASIVPKVASFFVETVRNYGPMIGKVAGGIIGGVGGFIAGGPMGAFQGIQTGMQIGEAIGGAASALVDACIPQGTLRISCTPSSIGSVMSQYGASSGFTNIFSNLPKAATPEGFASAFGGGSISNILGNFQNKIPASALSFFGLGSLFPK